MPAGSTQSPLSADECDGIVLAARSAFTKLKNLYQEIAPVIQRYGFTVPSAGVIARDLSEKIEVAIAQHCASFTKGDKHCDLARESHEWEVKVCKDSGLTINQSKAIRGENYIVVNYKTNSQIVKVWVLWEAQDQFFSPRRSNANARALVMSAAAPHIEILFNANSNAVVAPSPIRKRATAKAGLANREARRTG